MLAAATWMDLEVIYLGSKSKTNIIWYHLFVESKKKKYMMNELTYKTEIDSERENEFVVTKRNREWGG